MKYFLIPEHPANGRPLRPVSGPEASASVHVLRAEEEGTGLYSQRSQGEGRYQTAVEYELWF